MFNVVIPARYASTRLPGKPLLELAGKPMLQWVFERANRSAARQVIIATDDERVAFVARGFNADVVLTHTDHASGTDRIAEVARLKGWPADQVVVNLQGDEPLMPPVLIDQVAELMTRYPTAQMATLCTGLADNHAFLDPNIVKVVADHHERALYFSRAPIPWDRDGRTHGAARRHIGLYAYRVQALLQIADTPPSPLEQLEKLEQLRALEAGMDIRVAFAAALPGPDVNAPGDVARVEKLLRG
ncbi:MAG TPA: 3-deoxy-manno-octulosonate cytidylyltransferase [Steroidobacteraceae bacterium]|nr:3-deoxy-manno-octulosonate cytidylyltransferase [Steroidobacteraceae bacterium]